MEELILTMMEALNDFNEADLNFTKKDVDKLVKEYINLDNIQCNELGWIVLFENGYITQEQFADLMIVYYIDGSCWLSIDSFDEILSDDYSYEIEVLNGEMDYFRDYFYDADVSYNWDKYNEETLNSIIKYCIKNELEYEEETITEDNTKIIDGKLYFYDVQLEDDVELEDIIDDLDELKTELNNAICEAQETADRDEVYNKVINAFENDIGHFERKNIKSNGKDVEKILIKLDVDIDEVKSELKDWYGDYNFDTEDYGSLEYILKEMEYFKFDKPYYDHIYGDIDDSYLNEITCDRLEF